MSKPVEAEETESLPTTILANPDSVPEPAEVDWLHSPKPKRRFTQQLIWLMLVVSIGLHGVLLLAPLPSEKKPATQKPEEKSVRITQLPTLVKPIAVKKIPKPTLPKPVVKLTQPKSVIPPVKQPKSEDAAQDQGKAAANANPWKDFPQYPGAQSGCYHLQSCSQTSDALAPVATFFEKELATKKYEAKLTLTEPNRKVYQVSRNNLVQFLSILTDPEKGTVYVLAPNALTLADLAKAKEVPPEIAQVFEGLDAEETSRENFAQPEAFYTADQLRSDIIDIRLIPNPSPDINFATFFDAYLSTNLRNSEFDDYSETGQSYGGGPIYLAKKDKLSLYINPVPTQDGAGTIVVIWKNEPK
ncbi:MAG: hypothetical protein KME16_13950 [Scytolyngbya sp. HA4215-MV1]|nr:hypothetical protein [Scytolyngbya sp. HA4215-MV1]